MRSFNSGREWWCALSPSAKEQSPRIGVHSLASKEFVTGTDILIGPLTFRKTLPDILTSCFFSPPSQTQSLTHNFDNIFIRTISTYYWDFFSQHYSGLSLCDSIKEIRKGWWRLLWGADNAIRYCSDLWSFYKVFVEHILYAPEYQTGKRISNVTAEAKNICKNVLKMFVHNCCNAQNTRVTEQPA